MHRESGVAAGSRQSAGAGAEVLRAGGNAVDATVAAVWATAAGDASITSLAGGGVLIHRDSATGEVEIADLFVTAPGLGGRRRLGAGDDPDLPPLDFRSVDIHFGVGETVQSFHIGRGAAAVTGLVPGLAELHARWGRLAPERLVAPAVRFLRDGVPVTPYQASCFRVLEPILRSSEEGRARFLDERGDLLAAGATYRDPRLAELLERLGGEGAGSIWRNEIAPEILASFGEERGGWITPEDLDAWGVEFRPPLGARVGRAELSTHSPPAPGGRLIALTLELLDLFEVAEKPPDSPERQRRLVAVFRGISEARAADPTSLERPGALGWVAARIEPLLSSPPDAATRPEPRPPGNTTHISVIDSGGSAAAVTLSHGEGCGSWIGSTGLHMNNILGEEDLFPEGLHRFTPGERLPTMMAPSILLADDGALTALGSGGSNRIRTAMAQVVSALAREGLAPREAVERGRLHFESGVLSAEVYALPGGAAALARAEPLATEVKRFDAPSLFFGGVHVVQRDPDGRVRGAGDPRRGGFFLRVKSEE